MTNTKSRDIHLMIQEFQLGQSPEMLASQILDILQALNDRVDDVEQTARMAANTASCLANGVRPD